MGRPTNLAIFDLDYTLTRKGTWGRFMGQCLKPYPWKWPFFLAAAVAAQLEYKNGKRPRITVKETMIQYAVQGWSRERLTQIARDFAQAEVPNKLRPGGLSQLQSHQSAGDMILIASAAADILVDPIAAHLGVEDYVATDMGWTADDRLKAKFASANCYGPQKLERVKAFIAGRGLERSDLFITTYSDSHADIPLFEFSDQAIVVNPSKKLKAYAKNKDVQIVDWG